MTALQDRSNDFKTIVSCFTYFKIIMVFLVQRVMDNTFIFGGILLTVALD